MEHILTPKPLSDKYTRLTPLSRIGSVVTCLCDCGKRVDVAARNLRNGNTKSCGCLHAEGRPRHGMTRTPTHKCWVNMRERCSNPNNTSYPNYGGRGITVCERWNTFENFLADMGLAPEGMTIDRIENGKGYEPGNCRWATDQEQALNRRSNRIVELGGVAKPLMVWCTERGLPYSVVHRRLRIGWDAERALSEPVAPSTGYRARRASSPEATCSK